MSVSDNVARLVKLCRILVNRNYFKALRLGAAAGVGHTHVLQNLQCATAVDVGANRGQFALAARHCFPAANIFSFEPLQQPSDIFRKVFADDQRVELFQTAIGPVSGSATIHESCRDDSSSMLPITDMQVQQFPGTSEKRTSTIRVGRLGDFVAKDRIVAPALLKMDVQGFELEALRGCEDLLGRFAWIYVECSFMELYEGQALAAEVIDWLHAHGFQLCGVYNMVYADNGTALQADFLFRTVAGG